MSNRRNDIRPGAWDAQAASDDEDEKRPSRRVVIPFQEDKRGRVEKTQREKLIERLAYAREVKRNIQLGNLPPKPLKFLKPMKQKPAKPVVLLEDAIKKDLVTYNKRVNAVKNAREAKKDPKRRVARVARRAIEDLEDEKAGRPRKIRAKTKISRGKKLYHVTYTVKYHYVNKQGKEGWKHAEINPPFEVELAEAKIPREREQEFFDYANMILKYKFHESYEITNQMRIVDVRTKPTQFAEVYPAKIREQKVGNEKIQYERFGTSKYVENKQCWYSFLTDNRISPKKIDEHFTNTNEQITVDALFNFIKKCKRSVYFVDLCSNTFAKYIEKNRTDNTTALVAVIANNHIYDITDKTIRASITHGHKLKEATMISTAKSSATKKTKADPRPHKQLPENLMSNASVAAALDTLANNTIYYNMNLNGESEYEDELKTILLAIIKKYKTVPQKVKVVSNVIVSITWKNITFWHNKFAKNCIAICQKLKLPYKNQSIQSLSREVLGRLNIDRNQLLSKLNVDTREIFNDSGIKCGGLIHRPETINMVDKVIKSFDITKCYSHIISTYEFPVFTIWDAPTKYSHANTINKQSFYFVEKRNMLMPGHGWYVGYLVEYAIEQGLITKDDIKFTLRPTGGNKGAANPFKKFASGCHDKKVGEYSKALINSAIGSLATKDGKNTQTVYTMGIDCANYYRLKFNSRIHTDDIDGEPLYRIDHTTNIINAESGKPAWTAIVQIGYMLVHKLWKEIQSQDITSKLLCITVDCVTIEQKEDTPIDVKNCLTNIKTRSDLGFIRTCDIPEEIVASKASQSDCIYFPHCHRDTELGSEEWNVKELDEWSDDDVAGLMREFINGALFVGQAGTGKSRMLKKTKENLLKKYQPDEICVAGLSNSSMNGNIKGITLHKLFEINIGHYKPMELKKESIYKLKYILIDEISMVPGFMYNYFLLLKRAGCKFYIYGDFAQIPPIENEKRDYANSIVLKQLTRYNKVVLTHNYRSNKEYVNICASGNISEYTFKRHADESQKHILDKFNIARNNDACEKINERCAQIYGKKGEVGSRILVRNTLNSQNVFNCQIYEVVNPVNHTVRQCFVDDAQEKTIEDWGLFMDVSELGYCVTVHVSQGMTIDEPYAIYQFDRFWDLCYRYVSLSRTSNPDMVRIDGAQTGEIYKITKENATDSDPIYIGSTSRNTVHRMQEHVTESKLVNGFNYNSKLNEYMRKNKCVATRIQFVLYTSLQDLQLAEDELIKRYDTVNRGLNSRVNFTDEYIKQVTDEYNSLIQGQAKEIENKYREQAIERQTSELKEAQAKAIIDQSQIENTKQKYKPVLKCLKQKTSQF